jgi:hypothetical protein
VPLTVRGPAGPGRDEKAVTASLILTDPVRRVRPT